MKLKLAVAAAIAAAWCSFASEPADAQVFLKEDTASQTVSFGPFVDPADGTAEGGLTIANTDVRIKINGGADAAKETGGCTHDINGMYDCTFSAADTADSGQMNVSVCVSGAVCVSRTYTILEGNVHDAVFGSSAVLGTSVAAILDDTGTSGVQLPAGEIDATAIANGAIDAATFASGAIDAAAIAADAIGASELAANAIGAAEIATDAIDADALAADAIAEVNVTVDAALVDIHLDHLLAATYDPASKPGAADALLNELVESDGGVARYTANALEEGPSGGGALTQGDLGIHETTIASRTSQTVFTLTGGSDDNDAYNGWAAYLEDQSTATQVQLGIVSDYVGSTKTVTLTADPGIFTTANGDIVILLPAFLNAGVTLADDAITGAKIATGAIGADEIAADAIGASELAANSITSSEVADDAIDAGAIAANAIGASEVADNAIDAGALATDAITAAKIAADAIGASELAADAIGAAEVAAGAIDAATFAADVDAEVLSYIVDDATRIDASELNADIDSLTFTVAGVADVNVQRVNDVAITGDGSGTPFNVASFRDFKRACRYLGNDCAEVTRAVFAAMQERSEQLNRQPQLLAVAARYGAR